VQRDGPSGPSSSFERHAAGHRPGHRRSDARRRPARGPRQDRRLVTLGVFRGGIVRRSAGAGPNACSSSIRRRLLHPSPPARAPRLRMDEPSPRTNRSAWSACASTTSPTRRLLRPGPGAEAIRPRGGAAGRPVAGPDDLGFRPAADTLVLALPAAARPRRGSSPLSPAARSRSHLSASIARRSAPGARRSRRRARSRLSSRRPSRSGAA